MDRSTQDGQDPEGPASQGLSFAVGFCPGQFGSDPRDVWLVRTIENEIIPRLMLAHRTDPSCAPPSFAASAFGEADVIPDSADVAAFTALLLTDDAQACAAFVDAVRARGVALQQIFLDLLTPAARLLGVFWERDECDFTEVTIGLWRIQNLVFDLDLGTPTTPRMRGRGMRRVMLAAVPGSQHTLGLMMVAEFFRRAGWDVWMDPGASADELLRVARRDTFDVIGLSAGDETQIDTLASVITRLRDASRNKAVGLMVGGPIFLLRPDLVAQVGADFTARDAPEAVETAQAHVDAHINSA